MYGVPKAERRTADILAAMGLSDKADAYTRTLSGGMRRRLLVAKAMVHAPPILVLDEPTAGVDVELRQQLWNYVRDLHSQGTTIVLTTHYLEEAEELCDRIAIINHGEVAACEPTPQLLSRIDEKMLLVRPDNPIKDLAIELAEFQAELKPDGQIAIAYRPSETGVEEILARLRAHNITIRDLTTVESDLEDIFLQLTRERS